jgi:hypothetical protein
MVRAELREGGLKECQLDHRLWTILSQAKGLWAPFFHGTQPVLCGAAGVVQKQSCQSEPIMGAGTSIDSVQQRGH